ncbi:MAG: glycosyltransferase family 4 protein [Acetobacteraceae bacterium]|nr:glycosyltransferase family 4 protein [Acetobacteraceae bacterium]
MTGQRSVLIDGYNLGLETGTGIATYARNLSYVTHDMGYRTDILYGMRPTPGLHPLLHEIAFFDPAVGKLPWWMGMTRFARVHFSPFEATAQQVPITGKVIHTHYRSRLPYFDTIYNSPDLFIRAEAYKSSASRFLAPRMRVRLPAKHEIAHWTYPLPLYVPGTKNVYTMCDLIPLRLPYTTLDNKRHYLETVRNLARRADHIVTISENSRRDIINLLGVPEEKITNTYLSAVIPAKYADKPENVVKREVEGTFNVKYKEYMLFYGAIEPKKNIGRLIEGFLAADTDTPLLIVGKLAWKYDQELRLLNDDAQSYLERVGSVFYRRRRIFRVDYAPFPLLVSLIKGAKAVLFPSVYEGFGLPILEGMMLGTPVLTSNESANPEIAEDAAVLVDPYNPREIAEAITSLDSNPELRATLAAKGRKQAQKFSPEAHARRLSQVYDTVLAKRPIAPSEIPHSKPVALGRREVAQTSS